MDVDPYQAHRSFWRQCISRMKEASFVCKEYTVNVFGFEGYDISVTTVQFYPCNVKATLDQKSMNIHSNGPRKLYLAGV